MCKITRIINHLKYYPVQKHAIYMAIAGDMGIFYAGSHDYSNGLTNNTAWKWGDNPGNINRFSNTWGWAET